MGFTTLEVVDPTPIRNPRRGFAFRLTFVSSPWKLTVRHGSDVSRVGFDSLEPAIDAMRVRAADILGEGPLEAVRSLRDFEAHDLVHARLEISGKGLFRPPTAGVDVRGDGTFVPYAGSVRREELHTEGSEDAFDAVASALHR